MSIYGYIRVIQFWMKLHRSYSSKYKDWTWRYIMGIVFLDEAVWIIVFIEICLLLVAVI